MDVNFGANQTQVETPVETPAQALVPVASLPVATARPSGLALGDKIPDFSEIVLPRLNMAQGIGDLKDSFPPGSLVFNRAVALFVPPDVDTKTGNVRRAATAPATITILGFRPTKYREKVSGGVRGLLVSSEAEVLANGGTLDYNEHALKQASGMRLFQPLADALCLVERPETSKDDDTVFVFECAGKKYALAYWAMVGASYTAAAKKVFFTKRKTGSLRAGYPTFSFSITSRYETWSGGKAAWIPVCVEKDKNSPELIHFVTQVLAGTIPESSSPAETSAE
jgi:hypothetical protein